MLGYIFEKYINQKQMGAYYTKEDITGYISQNTIIPFLFDAARATRVHGDRLRRADGTRVWRLLAADPDRYIYPAVRHGVGAAACRRRSLPALDDVSEAARAGTGPRRPSTPCPPRSGARWWPAGNATQEVQIASWQRARSAASTT